MDSNDNVPMVDGGDFYLIDVEGSVEPSLVGPFHTHEERDEAARAIREEQDIEDALFWLDLRDGKPVVGAFMAGYLDDEEEEA